MEILPMELRKLGLKAKEISVYLAALELGFCSAQKIAQKAGISRPTAYAIIKELEKKGLMVESKNGAPKDAKNYFSAESPDKLLGLLRVQKREIEEKEREFIRIISALRAKYYLAGQNEIRPFAGAQELQVLLDDFSQSQTEKIIILADNADSLAPWREKYPAIKKRLGELQLEEKIDKNFSGTLIAYDKLIYLPPQNKTGKKAFLMVNQEIVEMIKNLCYTKNAGR